MKLAALVALLCTATMASAQSAPPNCSDAEFTSLCIARSDSPQTCACRIRVMHDVLTPDEIKWTCWFQSNPQAAERAIETFFKEPEKAQALGMRLIEQAVVVNRRCAEVR